MTTAPVALSIRQPWASLIVEGFKDIENRGWRTTRRGRFFVHASKTLDRDDLADARDFIRADPRLRDLAGITAVLDPEFLLPRCGGIIGSVEIVGCHDAHPSPWFMGPRGFSLTAPRRCDRIAMPGKLGFFPVPSAMIDGIAA